MDIKKFKQSLAKISTKDITINYNDGRIIGAKDLLTLAQIYKENNKTIIVMLTKRNKKPDQAPKGFTTYMDGFRKEIYEYINNPPQPPKGFTTYMDGFRKEIYEYINNPPQPPKWFMDYALKQEQFNKTILTRLDAIVEANHLIDPTKTKK